VECPWHQSVYDLQDGSVVHGPSTYAVPAYETRTVDGKVEVRLADIKGKK
jgi:nitrite reductase/ring-hydroxylating ferredoxin subunit